MGQNATGTTQQTTEPAKLYVVLHGELAINEEEGSDWFRVFAGYMPEHVYMTGPWFGEQHVQSGSTFVLAGAVTGKGSARHHSDQILLFEGGQCDPSMSFMEFILPRPADILTVNASQFEAGDVQIYGPAGASPCPPPGLTFSPRMALCHVFVYDVEPGVIPSLSLAGEENTAYSMLAGEGTGWFSLHIFAEADTNVTAGHVESALRMSTGILGIDAIAEANENTGGNKLTCPLPEHQISLTLSQRIKMLAALTSSAPAAQQWAELNFGPTPVSSRPISHDGPYSCGPVVNISHRAK